MRYYSEIYVYLNYPEGVITNCDADLIDFSIVSCLSYAIYHMILSMNRPSNISIIKPKKVDIVWNSEYQDKQERSNHAAKGVYRLLNTLNNSYNIFKLPIILIRILLLFSLKF